MIPIPFDIDSSELPLSEEKMTLWAYYLVDRQLLLTAYKNGHKLSFSYGTVAGKQAVKIFKQHALVTFSSPFLPGAILTLTQKGTDVIAAGGIQKYLEFWNSKMPNSLH